MQWRAWCAGGDMLGWPAGSSRAAAPGERARRCSAARDLQRRLGAFGCPSADWQSERWTRGMRSGEGWKGGGQRRWSGGKRVPAVVRVLMIVAAVAVAAVVAASSRASAPSPTTAWRDRRCGWSVREAQGPGEWVSTAAGETVMAMYDVDAMMHGSRRAHRHRPHLWLTCEDECGTLVDASSTSDSVLAILVHACVSVCLHVHASTTPSLCPSVQLAPVLERVSRVHRAHHSSSPLACECAVVILQPPRGSCVSVLTPSPAPPSPSTLSLPIPVPTSPTLLPLHPHRPSSPPPPPSALSLPLLCSSSPSPQSSPLPVFHLSLLPAVREAPCPMAFRPPSPTFVSLSSLCRRL